jgi:hypothetical protein
MFRPPDESYELEREEVEEIQNHVSIISALPCNISISDAIYKSPNIIPFASSGRQDYADNSCDCAYRRYHPIKENAVDIRIISSIK